MNRDPRPYNGLLAPGNSRRNPADQTSQFGLGNRDEQVKQAIALEMQTLTRRLFEEAAVKLIGTDAGSAEFAAVAKQSHQAAKAYFVGLGVIELDESEEKPGE